MLHCTRKIVGSIRQLWWPQLGLAYPMAEKGHPCPSQFLSLSVNSVMVECWRKCLPNPGLPSSGAAMPSSRSDFIGGKLVMDRYQANWWLAALQPAECVYRPTSESPDCFHQFQFGVQVDQPGNSNSIAIRSIRVCSAYCR